MSAPRRGRWRTAALAALALGLGACGARDVVASAPGARRAAASVCRIATVGYPGGWGTAGALTDALDRWSAEGVSTLADATLTDGLLSPYQLLVVEDVQASTAAQAGIGNGIVRTYGPDEVAAVARWVQAGGGLLAVTGYGPADSLDNVNALLAPSGLSYGTTDVLYGGSGFTVVVTGWASHPVTAGVTAVGVDHGFPVLGSGTAIAWEPAPGQADMGRVVISGQGRVFAWGDDWITYDAQWATTTYQVARLWENALGWLAGGAGCRLATPGP